MTLSETERLLEGQRAESRNRIAGSGSPICNGREKGAFAATCCGDLHAAQDWLLAVPLAEEFAELDKDALRPLPAEHGVGNEERVQGTKDDNQDLEGR